MLICNKANEKIYSKELTGCPLGLTASKRPKDCDNLMCEISCPLYIKAKNIRFIGVRQARRTYAKGKPNASFV